MSTTFRTSSIILLALSLGACSTIQSLFPDKQKEYRFSSEIPALEIPPDLIGSSPELPEMNEADAPAAQMAGGRDDKALAESPIGKYRPAAPDAEESAMLTQDDTGACIVVEAPFVNVWTMTEKALNRLFLEVKDKDRSEKVFFVYYSKDAKPFKPSWTDDLLSPFRSSSAKHENEREYQIRLEEKGDLLTKIRVLNDAGEVQSQGEGKKLLHHIHQKILRLDKPDKSERIRPEDENPEDDGFY
ncbi:MAG: outer membrane protein assembly factor BamC [Methylococcaceae bacterium]|nr:MAG: outer membrane protein assembly factor BamC [Methylococcaceae bacterium]